MIKIFISGKKGAGKDTLFHIMKEGFINSTNFNYNDNIYCRSFADPIKKIAKTLFPQIPNEFLYGESKLRGLPVNGLLLDGNEVTIRDILIDIGQNFKKYNQDIFVRIFDKDYKHLYQQNNYGVFFVTDVRFPVEFKYLNDNNFYSIRIVNNRVNKLDTISETAQDILDDSSFDYVVKNNGTINDLSDEALKIVSDILLQKR